jgi:hypothetical protein
MKDILKKIQDNENQILENQKNQTNFHNKISAMIDENTQEIREARKILDGFSEDIIKDK